MTSICPQAAEDITISAWTQYHALEYIEASLVPLLPRMIHPLRIICLVMGDTAQKSFDVATALHDSLDVFMFGFNATRYPHPTDSDV